ncbi:uncharacterized protein SPAPADRAFT_60151 [Spathaspora passalidarum NRRL Y-27907]|uniref:Thioredoxin domain-containing protein n=1 Tax=Spathaspora passalidarum (strain NRRL Y-27907 / 11-Y1) TaxID=619300 RepID=G3AMF4_SPAPN|nr:uncharacterized protein SPAPADRAFT_60151 [Spathaspora passalidarum NRRL Y-27907]EGW32807.1 hypothetical protein SPAPADRAFT_60151 [Spathaspora passalidarum NRRL Y-27907]
MFLPKAARIHQVNYDGPIEINAMKKWAVKLGANSKYEVVTKKTLGSHMKLVDKLEPGKINHDGKNAVSVVFYFDEVSVTPEDESVLTHLLLELQKSPFNTRLLISKHKQLEEHVNSMSKELIKYINYDAKAPEYKYNKPMEIATTLTAKPTILVFKDNTLMVDIYQTYAPEDIRIFGRVEDFIRRSQFPTYHELTPDLLPSYFTKFSDREYKVVIAFVDSKKDITTDLDNLVLAAHEYHHLKKEYYYHKLESDRQRKQKWIDELKKQNTESVKVIEAMRKEIPHLWNNDDVLFTYIDKSKASEFNYIPGWKLDIDQYDSGDAIVLSKDYRYYWDHDVKGQKLKNDPATMKHVLLSLLDPRLENSNVVRRVTGSPYSTQFQFMDHIHDYGIFGYLALFSVVYLLGYFFVRRRRRRHRTGNGNTGIIGAAVPKKD